LNRVRKCVLNRFPEHIPHMSLVGKTNSPPQSDGIGSSSKGRVEEPITTHYAGKKHNSPWTTNNKCVNSHTSTP